MLYCDLKIYIKIYLSVNPTLNTHELFTNDRIKKQLLLRMYNNVQDLEKTHELLIKIIDKTQSFL